MLMMPPLLVDHTDDQTDISHSDDDDREGNITDQIVR